MSADREHLRTIFEQVAVLYDRARPTYPAELFDDLAELAGLSQGSRVLEIGPGTGKATMPLAERGLDIVGVELGAQPAAVARRNLAAYPNVEVVNAAFEEWQPTGTFDAVLAFTAFHWIDPDLRYEKSAQVLREGGALAVVSTQHVLLEDGDRFFAEVQDDYDAVDPDPHNRPPPPPDESPDLLDEIRASGRYRDAEARRYLWDVTYDADAYISVLDTYSGHRALDDATRLHLFDLIRRRIEARPGGTVRKTYLAILNVARKS